MSDALVSLPVAATAGVAAAALTVVAVSRVKRNTRENIVPLMGVTGAFIFAAQMLNFAIPGTGSSGHVVGGVLLAAMLGPWAGFLTLMSVIIIQCLIFADGGLMALGCNILNMAAVTTLVAYPLVYRPIAGNSGNLKTWRVAIGAVAACVVGLELGAMLVVTQTELSGITALPLKEFIIFMLPIHLVIGLCEGLATAAVLMYVMRVRPDLLAPDSARYAGQRNGAKRILTVFATLAVIMGGGLAFFASSNPDGLEWSIGKVAGTDELPAPEQPAAKTVAEIQESTSILPDYDNTLSGIIGSAMVVLLVWGASSVIMRHRRHSPTSRR